MSLRREVKTHIRRSPYQALAATLTMFLTFLVGGVFFLATMASVAILGYFEGKPQVTVFFTPKAGQIEADSLKTKLEATGKVSGTHFVSKEDALAIYRAQNQNDPLLLEMVTADILPASLEVSATDPQYLSELAQVIQGSEGVDEVIYQRDVVDSLLAWTNAIRWVGGTLALLLVIDSLLIIGTVIAMKIALKRDEVEILTLVGATPWAIRAPFILEGGLYGLTGASIASLILTIVIVWLRPYLFSFLGVIPILAVMLGSITSSAFLISIATFMVGTMLLGFILGALGSSIALRRYLK
ncbi:MAG TPA: permease-like cell division protein FtsX [Patescibacteria group bacterium]|nr:permease-like cell division protein FtsX [Patescibacteria group bacterium]